MATLSYLKVEESFIGKLGTSQDYTWLYEEQDGIENLTDDEIRDYVDQQAGTIYDFYTAACDEAGREALAFEVWKSESDYEDAVQAMIDAANEAQIEIVGGARTGVEVYNVADWSAVHQALKAIPHYWQDNTVIVAPSDVGPAVEALNALGLETDEDGHEDDEF